MNKLLLLCSIVGLLSGVAYAGSLDLPGNFSASYDQRLNNFNEAGDNTHGRMVVDIEQGFSLKRYSKDALAYVGYYMYAPHKTIVESYLITGIRNQSLLPPFTLAIQYEKPTVNYVADNSDRITFLVSYARDWNLAGGHHGK